jgi:hypothetical protein
MGFSALLIGRCCASDSRRPSGTQEVYVGRLPRTASWAIFLPSLWDFLSAIALFPTLKRGAN